MKHLGQLPDLPGRRLDVWVVIAAVALQDLFRVLGYLLEEGRETLEDADCYRLTLDATAGDTPLKCTVWLDAETLLPRYAEFAADDAVVVSAKLLAFSCALQEPEQ